tara:strand:+ start:211 stop:576 length:366 start_codon:yes stop_codon:yes gene_type:complete
MSAGVFQQPAKEVNDMLPVQSRHLVQDESFWLESPDFTDVFICRGAGWHFEITGVIIGTGDVCEVGAPLIVAVVVIPFYGCVFERAVHPFALFAGPRVLGFASRCLIPSASQIMSKRIGRE